MQFITLTNKKRKPKNLQKYLINWSADSRSKFQTQVKKFLKNYWLHNVVFEEFPIVGTKLSLDFYNANKKIAIEVQGRQHTNYVKFFHQTRSSFLSQLKRDQNKERFCELNNIILITIYEKDIINKDLFEDQGVIL